MTSDEYVFYDIVDGLLAFIFHVIGEKTNDVPLTEYSKLGSPIERRMYNLHYFIAMAFNLSSVVKKTLKCMRLHLIPHYPCSLSQQIRSLLPYWAKGIFLSKIYRNNRPHLSLKITRTILQFLD
ncbi:hypothetical protein PSKAS_13400 [Peribacillus sp. N1]